MEELETNLVAAAQAVRQLSVDAILAAGSGHVGLPLGCAELGALLYGEILKHDPTDPAWFNRDRFVLSAGHGSMLLYSLLHLSGYDVSLDDIRQFRQLGSRTPGHPEYRETPGIETTTGPLGQGFANAVGLAVSEAMLGAKFNRESLPLVDHFTYVLAGEGDLMEGVTYEAASIAGHLALSKLIVFIDSNQITIDGRIGLAFSENIEQRFTSCGWQVETANVYDRRSVVSAVHAARSVERPSLIVVSSVIGAGLRRVKDTTLAHGGALNPQDAVDVRQGSGQPDAFSVDPEAYDYFRPAREFGARARAEWTEICRCYEEKFPDDYSQFDKRCNVQLETPAGAKRRAHAIGPLYRAGESVATRVAGGAALNAIRGMDPSIVGGAADLTVPCFGPHLKTEYFTAANREGWYIPFGVREHAMGAICNGLALHGGHRPFCGTFLAFSDYMRPAIRMAALMGLPVVFVLTHDSIRIGQDGPTHQPVEHLAALRAVPNLRVIRPADALETVQTWQIAIQNVSGPTAIVLTRQDVEVFARECQSWKDDYSRGAYVVEYGGTAPELVVVASGSEVQDVLGAKQDLAGESIRIVSMPDRETYVVQPDEWKASIIPVNVPVLVVEAGVAQGWRDVVPNCTEVISIESFGRSGPGESVAEAFGFSVKRISERLSDMLEVERTKGN